MLDKGVVKSYSTEMENKFRYQMQAKAKAELRRKEVRRMYALGLTWVEIGRRLSVSPQRAQQLGKTK